MFQLESCVVDGEELTPGTTEGSEDPASVESTETTEPGSEDSDDSIVYNCLFASWIGLFSMIWH